jgi:hypothetical protein
MLWRFVYDFLASLCPTAANNAATLQRAEANRADQTAILEAKDRLEERRGFPMPGRVRRPDKADKND